MTDFRETMEQILRAYEVPDYMVVPDGVHREVQKLSSYAEISCCLLTDSTGVNHCEHPPPPRPHWRKRLRWRWWDWRARQRMRLGSWIAGVDLDEREDC